MLYVRVARQAIPQYLGDVSPAIMGSALSVLDF